MLVYAIGDNVMIFNPLRAKPFVFLVGKPYLWVHNWFFYSHCPTKASVDLIIVSNLLLIMKHLFLFIVLVCCTSITALAQATASVNQTINTQDITTLQLDLNSSNIEIRETKGSRLIVETHITVEGINNPALLEYIVKSGRYELNGVADVSTQTLTLSQKGNAKLLVVKGQTCTEQIHYTILVPSNIKNVDQNSGGPAQ